MMKFQNKIFLIFVSKPNKTPFLFLTTTPRTTTIASRIKMKTNINEMPPRLLNSLSSSSKPAGKLRFSKIPCLSKEDRVKIPFTVLSNNSALAGNFMLHFKHANKII